MYIPIWCCSKGTRRQATRCSDVGTWPSALQKKAAIWPGQPGRAAGEGEIGGKGVPISALPRRSSFSGSATRLGFSRRRITLIATCPPHPVSRRHEDTTRPTTRTRHTTHDTYPLIGVSDGLGGEDLSKGTAKATTVKKTERNKGECSKVCVPLTDHLPVGVSVLRVLGQQLDLDLRGGGGRCCRGPACGEQSLV